MSFLTIDGLSKRFGNNLIINNLRLTIKEGEFISILGPSGSGKSTLFNLIGGILSPDEGSIVLNNEVINGKKGEISYMPQTPSLFPWRTILQNVLLGQELKEKKNIELAKSMLQKAGLTEYANAYPNELSGGMKQRASFIRALLSPSRLLCLDEPFSALDELTRLDMQKWLLTIWEDDLRTVLFITHNIEEALFLSDRILVLSNKPAELLADFIVPFARPRNEDLFLKEDFLHYKKDLFYLLRNKDINDEL